MKLTKTEQKIIDRLNGSALGRVSVAGRREVAAARKLADAGLVAFKSNSGYVSPRLSHKRNRMGDYVGFMVFEGVVSVA